MKPLVIYHANCADGFGAAFAAWLKFGEEAEYLPMQYGDYAFTEDGLVNREVYILDFSLPKGRMDKLFEVAKRVVCLDHHKSAFEMWCGAAPPLINQTPLILGAKILGAINEDGSRYEEIDEEAGRYVILDDNKSGAMLAWEYFHPDKEIPLLIKHIDDHDRWQFKIEGTKEFNKALWSYAPWSFEQWKEMFLGRFNRVADYAGHDNEHPYLQFLVEGAAILRAHDANVQAVVKGAGRKCLLNLPNVLGFEPNGLTLYGIAANCPPHLASDVGHQLATASGTYGLLWHINKENKCLCSLRSNGDYDVSAIARAFGGGGHKNAARFEVAISTLLDWIK